MNFPKLISVQAIEKYILSLTYNDGTTGLLDMSHFAGQGVFNYWEKDNNFFNVYVNPQGRGIAWSDELDICPDAAYLKLKGLTYEEWKDKTTTYAPA
jgi:hypothetical protein